MSWPEQKTTSNVLWLLCLCIHSDPRNLVGDFWWIQFYLKGGLMAWWSRTITQVLLALLQIINLLLSLASILHLFFHWLCPAGIKIQWQPFKCLPAFRNTFPLHMAKSRLSPMDLPTPVFMAGVVQGCSSILPQHLMQLPACRNLGGVVVECRPWGYTSRFRSWLCYSPVFWPM